MEEFQWLIYIGMIVGVVNIILSVLFWLMVWRVYKFIPNILFKLEDIEGNQRKIIKANRIEKTGKINLKK